MSKITNFSARVRSAVGGDTLGSTYYQFLVVHTGFMIFTGLPSVFINTFLMSQTSDIDVVLVYNMLNFSVRHWECSFLPRQCTAFIQEQFLFWEFWIQPSVLGTYLFNTRAAEYVFILGVTSALASAFYWISYSQLLTEYTDLQNRDSGMAIVSIVSSIVNLVAPLVAGALISVVGGTGAIILCLALRFSSD